MDIDGRGRSVIKFGMLFSFVVGLLFSMTPMWYLALVAGMTGGLFFDKFWQGTSVSCFSVALAWFVNIQGRLDTQLLNRVLDALQIETDSRFASIVIVIVVGAVLGALGGALGSVLRRFRKKKKVDQKED